MGAKTETGARAQKEADWRIACDSLADVRANIDRLDVLIVRLMCERLHFVTEAAKFKPSVAGVVVPARVEEIIQSVRALAVEHGANPDAIEAVYRTMIDAFTRDEQARWRSLHGGAET
jgi:isochorismate pyruvate lyase